MSENQIENGQERILTREEILLEISNFTENFYFLRELSDEHGIYLLEVKVEGKSSGEFDEYLYIRKGGARNNNTTSETTIFVTHYKDDIPISGENLALFKSETGEWEEVK
jgi:hypothetical protein